jgi:hypothetical protein
MEVVYVALLHEGVSVWRPTQAKKLEDGTYELLATPDYDPDDETWEFLPGALVVCEAKKLSNRVVLAAIRPAGSLSS